MIVCLITSEESGGVIVVVLHHMALELELSRTSSRCGYPSNLETLRSSSWTRVTLRLRAAKSKVTSSRAVLRRSGHFEIRSYCIGTILDVRPDLTTAEMEREILPVRHDHGSGVPAQYLPAPNTH